MAQYRLPPLRAVADNEAMEAKPPKRRFQFSLRTLMIAIAILAAIVWIVVDRQRLMEERDKANPTSHAGIIIEPRRDMLDVLDIPLADQLVGVRQCDFVVTGSSTAEFVLRKIKGNKVSELARVAVNAFDFDGKSVKGTCYMGFATEGGDVETLTKILSIGIATASTRRYEKVADFAVDRGLAFQMGQNWKYEVEAPVGKEKLVWGLSWVPAQSQKSGTVQDMLRDVDNGPFKSSVPKDIIERAKAMPDTVIVIATLEAKH